MVVFLVLAAYNFKNYSEQKKIVDEQNNTYKTLISILEGHIEKNVEYGKKDPHNRTDSVRLRVISRIKAMLKNDSLDYKMRAQNALQYALQVTFKVDFLNEQFKHVKERLKEEKFERKIEDARAITNINLRDAYLLANASQIIDVVSGLNYGCFGGGSYETHISGLQNVYYQGDTISCDFIYTPTTPPGLNDLILPQLLDHVNEIRIQDTVYKSSRFNNGVLEHHFTAENGTHRVPVQMIVETECGLDTIQKTYTVNVH